jgi:integrase/recombinase XerD
LNRYCTANGFCGNTPAKKAFDTAEGNKRGKILTGLLSIKNIKHKALLFTAYSAGLRVSEVVNLLITDIDSDRMQIRIRYAKGKKDRMATLANATLQILREYFLTYRPKKYLFEGQGTHEPYSTRSAQQVFNRVF